MRLGPTVFGILLVSLVAGCLGGPRDQNPDRPSPGDVPGRWSYDQWNETLTTPTFGSIARSVHHVTAFDGTRLSLTLFLPQELPPDVKLPTLVELTPYQSLNPDVGPVLPAFATEYVKHGVALVAADARGTNGSDGCLDFGGTADRRDAQIFAEWIRAQPWSNGKIVVEGVSHPGMGAVVAHAAIPGLTASIPTAPVVSYYQDEWLQGAKFEDQVNGPAYQGIELAPSADPDPESMKAQAAACTGKTTLDFERTDGRFDALWQDRDLSRFTPEEKIPILFNHGFVDLNVHPDHTQMYWDALPEDYPKYAIMGWWYHGYPDLRGHPWADNATSGGTFGRTLQRWFDATLLEKDNGLWQEPNVLVEDSKGGWHESQHWPLDGSRNVTYTASGMNQLFEGIDGAQTGRASYTDRIGAVRGHWTDASVVFKTDPLPNTQLINGMPLVHLYAQSNVEETKWVTYLIDEAPNGTWQRISHGYADSHTWKDPAEWLPIEPGKTYKWTLKLQPTAVVVEEGHRILLLVASQDSRNLQTPQESIVCFSDYRGGCYDPSGIRPATTAGRAQNTVITGPEGTMVHLSVLDQT
ncbi:MAG TPA: CocE/NonD family hydrolase [Candidatus Thermoplasmatota archaeon]